MYNVCIKAIAIIASSFSFDTSIEASAPAVLSLVTDFDVKALLLNKNKEV